MIPYRKTELVLRPILKTLFWFEPLIKIVYYPFKACSKVFKMIRLFEMRHLLAEPDELVFTFSSFFGVGHVL